MLGIGPLISKPLPRPRSLWPRFLYRLARCPRHQARPVWLHFLQSKIIVTVIRTVKIRNYRRANKTRLLMENDSRYLNVQMSPRFGRRLSLPIHYRSTSCMSIDSSICAFIIDSLVRFLYTIHIRTLLTCSVIAFTMSRRNSIDFVLQCLCSSDLADGIEFESFVSFLSSLVETWGLDAVQ